MNHRYIKTVDELVKLDLQNCYSRYAKPQTVSLPNVGNIELPNKKLEQSLNIILVGKPVIASFMGISEKTLKRWFVKYPDLPIQREQYRCYALTNYLIIWGMQKQLDKLDSKLVKKARYIVMSELSGVTLEHYMKYYVYKSQYRDETNKTRLRTKKYYNKTVNRVVSTVRDQFYLKWGVNTDLEGHIH